MQKRSILFIVFGLIILAGSFFVDGKATSAPEALQIACKKKLENNGAQGLELMARCKETTFAIAMTATNAQDAAKAISSSNQSDIMMNTIQKFLWGFGGVLIFLGVLMAFKRDKATL